MELLKQKIRDEGIIRKGNVIQVDSFLNHQLDVNLLQEMGKEIKKRFMDDEITKILTIESSGIAMAVITAQYFDNIPVVFAKKKASSNLDADCFTSKVHSYTKGMTYDVRVSKRFINEQDRILIIDDFLANGEAMRGLINIVDQANAKVCGCCSIIEKGFQNGGKEIRERGIHLESLAIIEEASEHEIIFRDECSL